MFSKELESLIQATLEDGKLEEYEKAALVKRATAEGADLTELEIYINSLLQKRQRELNQKKEELEQKCEKEKKEAFGRTCPNCGAQVPPLTLKCECGYEFATTKAVSSIQILSDKLSSIKLTEEEKKEIDQSSEDEKEGKRERFIANKKIDIISTFPIPNTKEDIIEFLAISVSSANKEIGFLDKKKNFFLIVLVAGIILPLMGWMWGAIFMQRKSFSEEKLRNAWRAKCEQVLIKGRSLRGDSEFQKQLDYYENMLKKK